MFVGPQAEVVRERSQREAVESRMKHEKELLEDVLHREMDRASSLQAELMQAQQAKVRSFQQEHLVHARTPFCLICFAGYLAL